MGCAQRIVDGLRGIEYAARNGSGIEIEPDGEVRGSIGRRLGACHTKIPERRRGGRVALYAVIADVDEEALAVDVKRPGPGEILGPLGVLDDEESLAVDGQVGPLQVDSREPWPNWVATWEMATPCPTCMVPLEDRRKGSGLSMLAK